jgi:hypothetical protein
MIGRSIRSRCMVEQQKTERPVQFEITDACKDSLIAWLAQRGVRDDDWIFPSRSNRGGHLTARQYGRLVDDWVTMIGLDPASSGTHSKLESTMRYLGVDIEDAISLSEDVEI